MKAAPLYFAALPLVTALIGFIAGGAIERANGPSAVKNIINYAAVTPTTEQGGSDLRRHMEISAITNIIIEPGRLSVFGRSGSRIWYYPK